MFFYRGEQLYAVRKGPWKVHFSTQAGYRDKRKDHEQPQLFHLEHDPSEKYNVSKKHPEVIEDIRKEAEKHRATIKPVKSQLEEKIPKKKTKKEEEQQEGQKNKKGGKA